MPDPTSAIVFIVQEPPVSRGPTGPAVRDMSSAQRYGRLQTILDSTDNPASYAPGPCLNKLSRELRAFAAARDYLCFAGGDSMALALAMLALRDHGHDKIMYLRWERERDTSGVRKPGAGFYVAANIPLRPFIAARAQAARDRIET